jgi:hypothetical protein
LGARDLFTEALGVDTPWHCPILEDFDYLFDWPVVQTLRERLNSLNTGVIICKPENGRIFHSGNDGLEGLEVAHALKGVDDLKFNWAILAATDF